jgi:hypothetical protein
MGMSKRNALLVLGVVLIVGSAFALAGAPRSPLVGISPTSLTASKLSCFLFKSCGGNATPSLINFFGGDPVTPGQHGILKWDTNFAEAPKGYTCVVYGSGVYMAGVPAKGQVDVGVLNSKPVDPKVCEPPPGGPDWHNTSGGPWYFDNSCIGQGYELVCGGAYDASFAGRVAWTSIKVVNGPEPTLTITGNGQSGTLTASVGDSIAVKATYAPGEGDTLLKTAINDYQNNLWCGSGSTCNTSMWTAPPLGQKSYTFAPTEPNEYIFYPATQTTHYPSWDNYGQALVIDVHPACDPGTHWVSFQSNGGAFGGKAPTWLIGTCVPDDTCPANSTLNTDRGNFGGAPMCICDAGYQMDKSGQCVPLTCPAHSSGTPPACTCDTGYKMNPSGQCVPLTCPGAHQVNPPACTCDIGYHMNGSGQCTPDTCPDLNALPPLCTTCKNPYIMRSGSCILVPAVSLSANPTRVQKGSHTTLTWSATNLGPSVSCSITSNPAGVFARSWDGAGNSWSGSSVATAAISQQTTFTLACTNTTPVTITVGLIPQEIEI